MTVSSAKRNNLNQRMDAVLDHQTAVIQAPTERLADLEAEVAALRTEVAALRDALAHEVRIRRVVHPEAAALDGHVPDAVLDHYRADVCYLIIDPGEYATVDVTANDIVPSTDGYRHDLIQYVDLVAWAERDVEPGGPYAEVVVVDGVELPRLTVAS